MTSNSETTIVNDIVHGIIKLPTYIKEIIDTDQFQRLRHIRQLGVGYLVYPSAGYSRFEHSIGTFHLASELLKQLKNQVDEDKKAAKQIKSEIPDITISDDDIKCVEIAALCHDLGHGPYSHVWEHAFDDKPFKLKKHEDLSCEIFSMLINNKKLGDTKIIKDKIGLNDNMIDLIRRIILGDFQEREERMFLFEIVANKSSGLDVDKFDYMCRDSIHFGWSNKNKIHDIKRILHFMRIIKETKTGEWHLAMRDREIFHIHDVFYYRHLLHRYGYQHKTVKAIECMFRQALNDIVSDGKLFDELKKSVMGPTSTEQNSTDGRIEFMFNSEFISRVCDYHIWNIMSKYTDIVGKIQERNLYKIFGQIQIELKPNCQGKEVNKDIHEFKSKLKELHVKFGSASFTLQSEGKGNPLLSVNFYNKQNPQEYFKYEEQDLPNLVKLISNENILMIFIETNETNDMKEKLEKIKSNLCRDGEAEFEGSDIKNEIENLRKKYIFKEKLF